MIHRDDINFEDAEALIKHMQELFPGKKIVFAGDAPELPEGLAQEIKEFEASIDAELHQGLCHDCGAKIPGTWPPDSDDFELPEGWRIQPLIGSETMLILCPSCLQAE